MSSATAVSRDTAKVSRAESSVVSASTWFWKELPNRFETVVAVPPSTQEEPSRERTTTPLAFPELEDSGVDVAVDPHQQSEATPTAASDTSVGARVRQATPPSARRMTSLRASRKLPIPSLHIAPEARSSLVGDLKFINDRVVTLAVQRTIMMHAPIESLQVTFKRGWEDDFTEIVLHVVVRANLEQGLMLWDAIGEDIACWSQRQSARVKRLLHEQYSIYVEPREA